MFTRPEAPKVSKFSVKPEDVQAWEDYYDACEDYVDSSKPGMDQREFCYRTMDYIG